MNRGQNSEILSQIKASVDMLALVGRYVVLKKSGRGYTGLCPFHSEKTPSFQVNENKKFFYCFGCKEAGDPFDFIQKIENVPFREAVQICAEASSVTLPKSWHAEGDATGATGGQSAENRKKQDIAFKLNRFAAFTFRSQLQASHLEYLRQRYVSEAAEADFYVGYAPNDWEFLSHKLRESKAPVDLALELGLIRPSLKGSPLPIDFFRGRILFPILDSKGRILGFGGRIFPGDHHPPDAPKFLNSSESFLFQKSRALFGLFQAQKHIREQDQVLVVEGYFDVLALYAAGVRNVVATCGTTLSPKHIQQLRRLTDRIVIVFDGDRAGKDATLKALQGGLEEKTYLYSIDLPSGWDPDQAIQEDRWGLKGFQERCQGASTILDQELGRIIEHAQRNANNPQIQSEALSEIAQWLGRLEFDPVGQSLRVEQISKQLGLSTSLLTRAIRSHSKHSGPAPAQGLPVARSPVPVARATSNALTTAVPGTSSAHPPLNELRLSDADAFLLRTLFQWDRLSASVEGTLSLFPENSGFSDLATHPFLKSFFESNHLKTLHAESLEIAIHTLLTATPPPELKTAWIAAQVHDQPIAPVEVQRWLYGKIKSIWKLFQAELAQELKRIQHQKNTEKEQFLLKQYLDVQRKMKDFSRFYDQAQ